MTDALVIGGGPAGAALATLLARAGREVVVVERHATPVDKVCGEFLSHEAGSYLRALGVDAVALGAVPVDVVALGSARHVVTAALPFAALSLSRRVLDEALLGEAARAGASLRRGTRVTELERAPGGWAARLADGTRIDARAAFLATGKHDLRSHKRGAGLQHDLVAFKLHWRLAPTETAALVRRVELALFDGGYAGLEPIEDGRANLCLLVRRGHLAAIGGWDALLAHVRAGSPLLDARLTGAEPCWSRPLALSSIPYGHMRDGRGADGPWRLGDQAAVIPSFSGDGISIALHSAHLAARSYLAGGTAAAYQDCLVRDVRRQVVLATALSHALVRPRTQAGLAAIARLAPRLLGAVASVTRVADASLVRASPAGPPAP